MVGVLLSISCINKHVSIINVVKEKDFLDVYFFDVEEF